MAGIGDYTAGPFILGKQRDSNPDCYNEYEDYLHASKHIFPPGGYELATSLWYFDARDHRCPHDAWLEQLVVTEPSRGKRSEQRSTSISVRLLGAYHDGHIELRYPTVHRYRFDTMSAYGGHRDWRYDEFRVTEDGHLIHEIEWMGGRETARWLIEADDVEYEWIEAE